MNSTSTFSSPRWELGDASPVPELDHKPFLAHELRLAQQQLTRLTSLRSQVKQLTLPGIPTSLPQSPRRLLFSCHKPVRRKLVELSSLGLSQPMRSLPKSCSPTPRKLAKLPKSPATSSIGNYVSQLVLRKLKPEPRSSLLYVPVKRKTQSIFPAETSDTRAAEAGQEPETEQPTAATTVISYGPTEPVMPKRWAEAYAAYCGGKNDKTRGAEDRDRICGKYLSPKRIVMLSALLYRKDAK